MFIWNIVWFMVYATNLVYSECPKECKCFSSVVACKNRHFQEEMLNEIPRDVTQLYVTTQILRDNF